MHPLPVERPEEGHTLAVAQICYDVYNPPNIESQNEIRQDWNLGCGHHEHDHKQDNGNQQRVRNPPMGKMLRDELMLLSQLERWISISGM